MWTKEEVYAVALHFCAKDIMAGANPTLAGQVVKAHPDADNAFVYKRLHDEQKILKMLHRSLYVREQPESIPKPFSKPRDTLVGRRDGAAEHIILMKILQKKRVLLEKKKLFEKRRYENL